MNILDLVTILIFAGGILVAGLSFSKSGKNMVSFFAAGGAVPWWISGLSLFMGFFSAGTFVVWGSIAYTNGWTAITIQLTMAIAGFIAGMFIAPRWRKTNVLTAAEYISHRLGVSVQKTYTYLFLFISLFTTGSFLYPVAKIVEVSTGLPLYSCILLLGGVSVLYVTVGGLWAVVVTDVLQFVILTAAVLIVIPLSFDKVGGVTEFINSAPEGFFNIFSDDYSIWFIVAFCMYNMFFLGGNWSYVQRYSSVRTPRDARKVGLLFGSLYLICPILWMLPPMIYRVYNPELSGLADEGAYLLMCKEALPKGLLGLMLGGMVFATASSLNGALNISAGVVTNDIFNRLRPNATNKELMRVARYSTICFGLLAIVVALLVPLMGGIVNVVISVAALTGVPLYLPVIWTLFSKRQTFRSVLTATFTGLIVNGLFKFITPIAFGYSFTRAQEMIVGVAVPIIIMTIFEIYYSLKRSIDPQYLLYKEWNDKRQCENKICQESQADTKSSNNKMSFRVIGIGICLSGVMIDILGIISNSGIGVVMIIGTLLAVLGLVIYRKNI